jgi:hypothetical protein
MKGLKSLLRRATRSLKKGVRGATRRVRKFFGRGGRRPTKGPLRRVTNAIRKVGKKFRNSVHRVFGHKKKTRQRRAQKGAAERASTMRSLASMSPSYTPMPTHGNPSGADEHPSGPSL